MEKDGTIRRLSEQLQHQCQLSGELQQRLEDMDANRRLSSLIFSCDDFTRLSRNADIEPAVVNILNDRIPDLKLTTDAIQAAHKLQNDNKVICKFVKRQVRDKIYDSRFDLARFQRGGGGRDGRRLVPLFISESLTLKNRLLFEELLRARRPENGGLVSSVFSRRGAVWCRSERGGANRRVTDEDDLRRVLGGRRFPPGPRPSAGGSSAAVPRAVAAAAAVAAPRAEAGSPAARPALVAGVEGGTAADSASRASLPRVASSDAPGSAVLPSGEPSEPDSALAGGTESGGASVPPAEACGEPVPSRHDAVPGRSASPIATRTRAASALGTGESDSG